MRSLQILGFLIPCFLLVACGPDEAPQEVEKAGARQSATTDGGSFEVGLKTLPDPLKTNEHFRLAVDVKALGSATLEGVAVVADADMPEHGHGMNTKPVTKKVGDGRYEVEGFLFHMPGYWELYIDVDRGDKVERATFKFNLD